MEILRKILLVVFLLSPSILLAEPVNINTADKETLMTALNGVGEKRAEAIIAYRNDHGPFKSVDELLEVSGIGQSILEKNKENLSVQENQ